MGRRGAYRLQRMPATGIYGDDHGHRSLWDEYRFEAQEGPTPALESAWDQALSQVAQDVIEKTHAHTKALLSWHLLSMEEEEASDAIYQEGLEQAALEALTELAAGR